MIVQEIDLEHVSTQEQLADLLTSSVALLAAKPSSTEECPYEQILERSILMRRSQNGAIVC